MKKKRSSRTPHSGNLETVRDDPPRLSSVVRRSFAVDDAISIKRRKKVAIFEDSKPETVRRYLIDF